MQMRTFLAIVAVSVALLAPMGVAWLTLEQLEPVTASSLPVRQRKQSKSDEQLVPVLVVSQPIPHGRYIKSPVEWFEIKALPQSSVPKNAATKFEQVRHRVACKEFAVGSTVNPEEFLGKEGWTTSSLPRGLRAMTIKVSRADCLAFQSGARVNIENRVSEPGDGYAQIILENLLILATCPVDNSDQKERIRPDSDTVTLAVTPEEAQTLALAQKLGNLHLVATPTKSVDP
jgi:pilus assembly protein CpaB